MSGTSLGTLKTKLGLKGKTNPGDMISRMNAIKAGAASGVGRLQKAKAVKAKVVQPKKVVGSIPKKGNKKSYGK